MKVAYDQMFINLVKKTLPKKYHFLLCLGFYEYLCGVYNIDDIVEKTQSFLRAKKYLSMRWLFYPEDLEYIKKM